MILAALAVLAPTVSASAAEHPAKPLLWKIEGNGVQKPSYLFGTIHVSSGAAATLHPAAQKAFDEAGAVHTEVPMDLATQTAAIPLVMRKDGKTLDESIGKELSGRLDAELKRINPQLSSEPFQTIKTWYAAVMPQVLPHQLAGGKPLDMVLWDKADAAGKKTAGMETMAGQTKGFEELTEAQQVTFMDETLKFMQQERQEGKDSTKDLIAAYESGEPANVAKEIEKSLQAMAEGDNKELGEQLIKRLLTDRDKIMADYITTTVKKDPGTVHFFAAGAGHFCTEKSIRSHLENGGFKITRIEE